MRVLTKSLHTERFTAIIKNEGLGGSLRHQLYIYRIFWQGAHPVAKCFVNGFYEYQLLEVKTFEFKVNKTN